MDIFSSKCVWIVHFDWNSSLYVIIRSILLWLHHVGIEEGSNVKHHGQLTHLIYPLVITLCGNWGRLKFETSWPADSLYLSSCDYIMWELRKAQMWNVTRWLIRSFPLWLRHMGIEKGSNLKNHGQLTH